MDGHGLGAHELSRIFLDTRRGSYPRRWFIETKTTEKRHNRPDEFKREAVLLLEAQLRR